MLFKKENYGFSLVLPNSDARETCLQARRRQISGD